MRTSEKKEIECVIFDFGGVIGFPQQKEHVDNMMTMTKMKKKDFEREYFNNRIDYDQGFIDKNEYWKRVTGSKLELDDDLVNDLVREDYHSWTKINEQIVEYINELRKKVKKVILLSNVNFEAKNYIRDDLKMFKYFDETFCSCDLKLMKPDIEIYEHVINELGVDPKKCLFTDDDEENIAGAKEAGLNGIIFKDYVHLKNEIEKLYELAL